MFKFLKKLFSKKEETHMSLRTPIMHSIPPVPPPKRFDPYQSQARRTRVLDGSPTFIPTDDDAMTLIATVAALEILSSQQNSVSDSFSGAGGTFSGAGASGDYDSSPSYSSSDYSASSSCDSGYSSSDSSSCSSSDF